MDNFFGIGGWELMVIGLIALIVLGPKQMILLARKAGEYLRQFQQIWQEASKTLDKEIKAIEAETPGIDGLGQEIQNLEKELKAAVNVNFPMDTGAKPSTTQTNTIQPPPSPAPPIPATPPPSTASSGSTPPSHPAPAPPRRGASGEGTTQPEPRYPAWTSKPEN